MNKLWIVLNEMGQVKGFTYKKWKGWNTILTVPAIATGLEPTESEPVRCVHPSRVHQKQGRDAWIAELLLYSKEIN